MIYTVTLNPAIDYVIRVPEFQENQLNVATEEYKFPGGKGINVARILKKLDVPAMNLGFVGGFTGEFIEKELQKEGLQTNFTTVPGDTRINIKLKSQVETEINGQGPLIDENNLAAFIQKLKELTPEDVVIFSGSLPKGVPADLYLQLVKEMNQLQVPFVVDISSKQLLEILSYQPVLIKPNHHELAAIFETTFNSFEEMIPYGEKLRAMGAQNVLLSMGKEGAALFTEQGIYRGFGLKGELKNSVGAGDSMVAGFMSQWYRKKDILECFKYGLASGSDTAFSDDLASREAILELIEKVNIQQVEK